MGCNLYMRRRRREKNVWVYAIFLWIKLSRELVDLFTKYKCIAFCTKTFYYNHVFGESDPRFRHGRLCTGTPSFPCFDVFNWPAAGKRNICKDMFFLLLFIFQKCVTAPPDLQGQTSPPSVIVYCTLSNHASPQPGTRPPDDVATERLFFFFAGLFYDCKSKKMNKKKRRRSVEPDVCALNSPTWVFFFAGLTGRCFFRTPSIMHALYWSMSSIITW